jgi:hypothetical protein
MWNFSSRWLRAAVLPACVIAVHAAAAQDATQQAKPARRDTSTVIEIYGFAMADAIYDFEVNNPDWFDVNRPSKLPAFRGEFGGDHRTWFSARQSRFGTKATIPTGNGRPDLKVVFDWDLFGVGTDAGQTTIRPRHMYGQWGKWGAGQTESPFMDLDIFPNIIEYWGPNGMLFFRNVQVFYQPINKPNGTRATIALERPGASADQGRLSDRVELQNVIARFPAPDISAEYRWGMGDRGYVELAGILRWMKWDDVLPDTFDLGGGTTGWGLSLSSNIKPTRRDVIRLQVIYGAGVENYFNDAPVDVGVEAECCNRRRPIEGKALPDFGLAAYLDHTWSKELSSAIGYSTVHIENSNLQAPTAYRNGSYASTNLLWTPIPNVLMGGEFQWGYRTNFGRVLTAGGVVIRPGGAFIPGAVLIPGDQFTANDFRLQFSFKYSFSQTFGEKP